jgi:hypothetical protein
MSINRKQLNKTLHALSARICGDDTALRAILPEYNCESTLQLTDEQAQEIRTALTNHLYKSERSLHQAEVGIGNLITKKQKSSLYAICKNKLQWEKQTLFSYILGCFPYLREKLTAHELKRSDLAKLYQILTVTEASKVIKRLDKIIKRNNDKASV